MDEPPIFEDIYVNESNNADGSIAEVMLKEGNLALAKKRENLVKKQRKQSEKPLGKGFSKGFFNQKVDYDVKKSNAPKLQLPQVQEKLASQQMSPSKWLTDDFMKKIASNPSLMQAFQHPKFTSVLQEMEKNPKQTMVKCQSDPQLSMWLKELMKLLGHHFEKLGASETKQVEPLNNTNPVTQQDLSDKDKAAMQRIQNDPELMKILQDQTMMQILQHCQVPGKMKAYMVHPVVGPKLRKLIDAGLVQIQN